MTQAAVASITLSLSAASSRDADLRGFLEGFIAEDIHLVVIGAPGWVIGRHFGRDARSAARWARRQNDRGGNVYFSVNRVRQGLNAKARKQDITEVRFAHLDIDPPKDGGRWNREAIEERLFAAEPRPTMVLASGNGLQAFWRVRGATIATIEAINLALAERFGGDPGVWNVDRIMRVPGTTNWPSARKQAEGRVPREAAVLWVEEGSYSAAGLAQAFTGRKGARS